MAGRKARKPCLGTELATDRKRLRPTRRNSDTRPPGPSRWRPIKEQCDEPGHDLCRNDLRTCRLSRPDDADVPAANGGKPSRHRGQAIARVPTLDWPVDLFGDNATLPELVTVDFLLQCDPVDGHHTSH